MLTSLEIFRRSPLFATVLSAAVLTTQLEPAFAQSTSTSIDTGAAAGRSAGSQFLPQSSPTTVDANGNVQFNLKGTATTLTPQQLFQAPAGSSASEYTGLYGSDEQMKKKGLDYRKTLQTDQSPQGNAYRVLEDTNQVSRPDLKNDPIWKSTDQTLNNLDQLSKDFGDCSTSSTFEKDTITTHVPDYQTCERVKAPTQSCTITHDYKAGVIRHVSGPLNLSSCGLGCLDVWLGTVGDNYWGGNCSIYEEQMTLEVLKPDAIQSATLDYAKWDDYMQVWVGGEKVWSGPNGNFPPETGGACELSTSWSQGLNVDITSKFKTAGNVQLKNRTSVSGGGEGYARMRIYYDPSQILDDAPWATEDCLAAAKGVRDGFCTGSVTVAQQPSIDAATGCGTVNGVQVCNSQFPPVPPELAYFGIQPLAQRVTVNSNCGFYKGQMGCYTDSSGVLRCPTNNGGNLNSCAAFESNPNCGFITSKCTDGAQGSSGECYVTTETWDCGYDAKVPTIKKTTNFQCSGAVRCMGTDCAGPQTQTQSQDFARAVAALQAANFMAMDGECPSNGNQQNVNCEVFKGTGGTCKKAVGGIVNCCQGGGGVALSQYIQLMFAVAKLDSAVGNLSKESQIRGAWETLRQPFDYAWSEVSQPFATAFNSITGSTTATATDAAASGLLTQVQQELTKQVAQWTADVFGEAAANSLFSVTAEAGGEAGAAFVGGQMQDGVLQLGGGEALIGSALSYVMWAYTIYQVTMILIQLIWQCETSEFELIAKRELKSCHYIGSYCATKVLGMCIEKRDSYCCFNSPLSRIMQEQVRPQLGMSWGDPKSPSCEGLPTNRFAEVDWSKVNLDEWLGILQSTGHLNTPDINKLTGSGSALNTDGSRENTANRAIKRLDGLDTTGVRLQATAEVQSLPHTDSNKWYTAVGCESFHVDYMPNSYSHGGVKPYTGGECEETPDIVYKHDYVVEAWVNDDQHLQATEKLAVYIDLPTPAGRTKISDAEVRSNSKVVAYQYVGDQTVRTGKTQTTGCNLYYETLIQKIYKRPDGTTYLVNAGPGPLDGPEKKCTDIVISTSQQNFNLYNKLVSMGWTPSDGSVSLMVTIASGVVVGSNSSTVPAFDVSGLPAGSQITVTNNGMLVGAGGNGGDAIWGGTTAGKSGGTALRARSPVIFVNKGTVAGGGGGGGALTQSGYYGANVGATGGGGAGSVAGKRGTYSNINELYLGSDGTLTTGGAANQDNNHGAGYGGNLGQAGQYAVGTGGGTRTSGGAAGYAIDGASYVSFSGNAAIGPKAN